MKYVGTYNDPKDIVTKEKLEAVASRVSTNEDNIAMAESDIGGLQTTVGTLQTNVNNVQTQLNKKLESVPVTSVNGKTGAVTLGKSDIGLGNVDNVKQYSASNPPPYPVTRVNGKTGAVTVHEVPAVTTTDNGKFLRVVNGAWAAVAIADANGVKF